LPPVQLNRDATEPLFRQIESRLAYEIVTGKRVAGKRLPSLRDAAEDWGVNLHTVRRAYRELAAAGLVEIEGSGTRVARLGPDREAGATLTAAVRRFAHEARVRYDASHADLVRAFADLGAVAREGRPACAVVECSRALSGSLADDLASRFDVDARPLDLHAVRDLPPGTIVGTYFHADELRDRLSDRARDLFLVRIRPAVALLASLARAAGAGEVRRVVLMDRLPGSARDLEAELGSYLGPHVMVETRVVRDSVEAFPDAEPGTIVLASPQTWDRLPESLRSRRDVRRLAYEVEPHDMRQLAESLGWSSR
jgi:DNA-binding transcriptional regulator YhcF (GntR family)